MYSASNSRKIQKRGEKISAIIHELIKLINIEDKNLDISFHDEQNILNTLHEKIKESSNEFKIIVIGEFKNGKSTFINAIIGRKIMPEDILPCTAAITEVKYGAQERAEIYFLDPLPEKISRFIPEKIKSHLNKYRFGKIPPLNLTIKEYQECVIIPEEEEDNQKQALGEMPYSHAVVYYPLDELKNGVNIIDTPGLNEDSRREEITKSYISHANAIIFAFKCPKYQGKNDENYINNIIRPVSKEIFFVCTFFDQFPSKDTKRFVNRAVDYLKNFTDLGEKGIFFVSSTEGYNINNFKHTISNYLRNNTITLSDLRIICEKIFTCIDNIKTRAKNYLSELSTQLDECSTLSQKKELALHNLEIKKAEIEEILDTAIERYDLINKIINFLENKYSSILSKEYRQQNFMEKLNECLNTELHKNIINSFINDLRTELYINIRDFYALSRNTSTTKIDLYIEFEYMFDSIKNVKSDLKLDKSTFRTYAADITEKIRDLLIIIKENISGMLNLEITKNQSQIKANIIISEQDNKAAYYKSKTREINNFMNKIEILRMELRNLNF